MESSSQPDAPASPRVLIVKLSSLGDLFHALPAVHGLKTGLRATIDWAVHSPYEALVQCFTDVTRVLPVARSVRPAALEANLRHLRARSYDLIVDLQGILKSAVAARAAVGARRIGPSFHREGARWLYHAVAGPRNKNRHAVEENLDILRFLGLPESPPAFPVAFPLQLAAEPRPRVALLPFSRWSSKNWPAASFARVGSDLQEQAGASLYLIGGTGDRAACDALQREFKERVVNLAGTLTLPQLGGVLQAMDLVIANDSGPMHMAAALGVPVLAMFGPTDPQRTGPYGAIHHVVRTRLRCQPCFATPCRYRDGSCLLAIPPDQVAAVALRMLRARATPERAPGAAAQESLIP